MDDTETDVATHTGTEEAVTTPATLDDLITALENLGLNNQGKDARTYFPQASKSRVSFHAVQDFYDKAVALAEKAAVELRRTSALRDRVDELTTEVETLRDLPGGAEAHPSSAGDPDVPTDGPADVPTAVHEGPDAVRPDGHDLAVTDTSSSPAGTPVAEITQDPVTRDAVRPPVPEEPPVPRPPVRYLSADEAYRLADLVEVGVGRLRSELVAAVRDPVRAAWRGPGESPRSGERIVVIDREGRGGGLFGVGEGGLVASDGTAVDEALLTTCEAWTYLPDDLRLRCERT